MSVVTTYCADVLGSSGFDVDLADLGEGCLALHATRGQSPVLVNCHLDTVPVCEGWTTNPHELAIQGDHAIGLGACDVKGSAAAILAAAQASTEPASILFTTDEEAGQSRCVRTFVSRAASYDGVVVCEPTSCSAVTAHRGLASVEVGFTGSSGHASGAGKSAVHDAILFAAAALKWQESEAPDARLSIGRIEGGIKPNMIAASATVRFGIRPAIGSNVTEQLNAIKTLACAGARWTERFHGPELAPSDGATELAAVLGVPIAEPVDFWTEASLFANTNTPAIVFGPGSIEQAHAPDEFVPIDALNTAMTTFQRLFLGALV